MGLDRLAQYLLEQGRITPEQFGEARRTQGFFGGQIGSHLLKLGYVDETILGEALREVSGVPYASGEQLRVIPEDARTSLDARRVVRLQVCPIERDGRTLRIAMLNPGDVVAIDEVRSVTGCDVEPWVTCEYRLFQALERHYRVEAGRPRAVTLAPPLPHERAAARRPESSAAERDLAVGLDGRPLDAGFGYEEHVTAGEDSVLEDVMAALERVGTDGSERAATVNPIERLDREILAAEDRDGIAGALLEHCHGLARRVALFAVGKAEIRVVAGRGGGLETGGSRSRALPNGTGSVLDTALGSGNFFFGVVPPLPANRELYAALGWSLPAMAMVLPVTVKNRVAALLYLDDDDTPMNRPDIPLMRRIAAKAGLAFEILLLRGKLRGV